MTVEYLAKAEEIIKESSMTLRVFNVLTDIKVLREVCEEVEKRLMPADRIRASEIVPKIVARYAPAVIEWPGTMAFADRAVRDWYRDHPPQAAVTESGGPGNWQYQSPWQSPGSGGWNGSVTWQGGGSGQGPGQQGQGDDQQQEDQQDQQQQPEKEPIPEPYGEGEHPDVFWDLVALMEMGLDVALVGPAGCGKTHMMMQAAKHLGRDFTITTAPQMPYDLTGFVDGHGRRVETAFTEAFTGGKVAGVDEGDRSSEDALIAVHAPIANRTMYLPGKGQTPAADGFQVVMTMNTYGLGMDEDYNTAHQLDTATRDRLVFLPVDFDPRIDAEMCGGDADLFRFAQAWRRAVEEEEATHAVLSYRTVSRLHSIAAHPRFGRIRALEIALVKGLPKHTLEGILNHLDGDNPWLTALKALERRMRE